MNTSKGIGYWIYWLFLYGIATIPAALFGGLMAGSYVHSYDMTHHPHLSDYDAFLNKWEDIVALLCATPGFAWVGWSQLQDQRRENEKLRVRQRADAQDDAVWPPPPLE